MIWSCPTYDRLRGRPRKRYLDSVRCDSKMRTFEWNVLARLPIEMEGKLPCIRKSAQTPKLINFTSAQIEINSFKGLNLFRSTLSYIYVLLTGYFEKQILKNRSSALYNVANTPGGIGSLTTNLPTSLGSAKEPSFLNTLTAKVSKMYCKQVLLLQQNPTSEALSLPVLLL